MKLNKTKIILVLSFIELLNGCTALVSDSMLRAAHQDMDKNHDGYVDYKEYLQTGSDKETAREAKEKGMTIEEYQKWDYNRADANKDGKVTQQELIDLFRKEF